MPYRWTHLRIVDPLTKLDSASDQPISLWWLALSAADETLQGGPLTAAWLRLFSAHLSQTDAVTLRWGGDMAESAELRRAYSALYGRYMARALMASRLGFTDFLSLRTNVTTLPGGVTVRRTARGDIPDWIAWDPRSGSYVLGEAKGSLTGKEQAFVTGTPSCVGAGKAQFGRVEVQGPFGQIKTRNWVAASLWATDARRHRSVSLLWDPPSEGEPIPESDRRDRAWSLRRRRLANQALYLSRPGIASSKPKLDGPILKIRASPSGDAMPRGPSPEVKEDALLPLEETSSVPHEGSYVAAVITPLGIRPIISKSSLDVPKGTPAMLFGLNIASFSDGASDIPLWLGRSGIATPDGLSLFDLSGVETDIELAAG